MKTEKIFEKFKSRIVQVRILEHSSGSKSAIGSGFFVTSAGHIMTNYHVIANFVQHPDRYKIDVVFEGADSKQAVLLDFDAVHDLAVIKIDGTNTEPFPLDSIDIPKGTRMLSMGNPYDLGLSIVEGTYNGLIENSLYEKIHLTGALNPGMSGGPTITESGKLVGINVATVGNQVSFLVPFKYGKQLLERVLREDKVARPDFLKELGKQLVDNQQSYMSAMTKTSSETVTLGPFILPGKIAPSFKCWGDVDSNETKLFDVVSYACSSRDDIYVSRTHSTGLLYFSHDYVTGEKLNPFLFYSRYEDVFDQNFNKLKATEEDVTNYKCETDFIDINGVEFKAAYCMRGFKKIPGLYDVLFRAASLNNNHSGIITSVLLSGVSLENSREFIKQYLGMIRWQK